MMDKVFTVYIQLTFLQMCQNGEHRKKYPLITTRFADALCAPFWLVQIYIALTLSDLGSEFLTISMFVFACTKMMYQTQYAGMYKIYVSMEFNVHGSVHRKNILIYIQQDATLHSLLYLETALRVSGGITTQNMCSSFQIK